MSEFVASKPKMHSLLDVNGEENKKAKRVKKNVVKTQERHK